MFYSSQFVFLLTYPTKKDGLNLFHPITKEVSRQIEEAIFQEVKSVMSKVYDSNHTGERRRKKNEIIFYLFIFSLF